MKNFKLWAAIDLLEGQVVRVKRGDLAEKTVYNDDPVGTAKRWEAAGADGIHLVDLAGAVHGASTALTTLAEIAAAVKIPVQFGGGLRHIDKARAALEAGAARVVVGTAATAPGALREWLTLGTDKLLISADVKGGRIATHGWTQTGMPVKVFLSTLVQAGLKEVLMTDIERDGMMSGVNSGSYKQWGGGLKLSIIASGGITEIDDLKALADVDCVGGAVLGKSIYENHIDIAAARAELDAMVSR